MLTTMDLQISKPHIEWLNRGKKESLNFMGKILQLGNKKQGVQVNFLLRGGEPSKDIQFSLFFFQ